MNDSANRVLAIDAMRGLTLFLMLFVNDLYVPGVPEWLTHRPADYDGMGLADWVFPGFLFMVGMAVPYAIQSRFKKGDRKLAIVWHILQRSFALLFIGVLMLNSGRMNAEASGISENLWAIGMYVSVFLIWNRYPKEKRKLSLVLKATGIAGLAFLILIFRSGTTESPGWMISSWWGILGLIGWGYLVTSMVYLAVKDRLLITGLIWLGFVILNMLSMRGFTDFLSFLKPIFGVVIDGNVPSIVMAGLFFSLLLQKFKNQQLKFTLLASALGLLILSSAFVLRNWFVISKIIGTPSWAMLCNGISITVFVLLFILIDVWKKTKWCQLFMLAGQNSLTTYLAPDIIYYSVWMSSLPLFFYKHTDNVMIVILGSVVWSVAMILFSNGLSRIGIRLKL